MDSEAVELCKKITRHHLYLYLYLCFLVFVSNLIRGATNVNCVAVEICKKLTSRHLRFVQPDIGYHHLYTSISIYISSVFVFVFYLYLHKASPGRALCNLSLIMTTCILYKISKIKIGLVFALIEDAITYDLLKTSKLLSTF